jgi:hypothetical protein
MFGTALETAVLVVLASGFDAQNDESILAGEFLLS